jgi:hypothetical protein
MAFLSCHSAALSLLVQRQTYLISASGRPVSENVAIGEQRRCPADMPEDDLVTGVEPSSAHQVEQRGHRLAGVGRVEQQAFELGGALHRVDHLVGRYPVGEQPFPARSPRAATATIEPPVPAEPSAKPLLPATLA